MKRYLITGASRGIGRAIAEKLAGAYALSRPAEVAVENIDLLNLTGRL